MWHTPYFPWNLIAVCQLEATQSCKWHTFVCEGFTLQILAAECLSLWIASILPQFLLKNASALFWYMYLESCTVYYPYQLMHTGNTNTGWVHHIQNNLTMWATNKMKKLFRLLIFLNQPYMFRATNSPILRSTFWLYIQLLAQCIDTAADRCHDWDVTVPSLRWHRSAVVSVYCTKSCIYSQKVLLRMG